MLSGSGILQIALPCNPKSINLFLMLYPYWHPDPTNHLDIFSLESHSSHHPSFCATHKFHISTVSHFTTWTLCSYSFIITNTITNTITNIQLYSFKHPRFHEPLMHNSTPPPLVSDLVLIGGGHAHVHVLRMLGMPAGRQLVYQHGIQVTLLCRDIHTPYSGMLPGYCAGRYTLEDIHIDLQRICRFANVRIIHATACQITYNNNNNNNNKRGGGGFVMTNDGRPPIRYDCLSIDIGSSPSNTPNHVIPVKPIAQFCAHYEALLHRIQINQNEMVLVSSSTQSSIELPLQPFQLVIVGGGAGGIELVLAIQYRLQQYPFDIQMTLVTRGTTLLHQHNSGVRRILTRILNERKIQVRYNAEAIGVIPATHTTKQKLRLTDTSQPDIPFDECLWCTSAGASTWMQDKTPFPTTSDGFLKVNTTLECLNHPGVFATGDCCHMVDHPRPKAGVFAVRAGPPLMTNLMRYLTQPQLPLLVYIPQTNILGLISTGDMYAIASRGKWFAMEGSWVWTWKDYIDRKWMDKYTKDLPDLELMMSRMKLHQGTTIPPNVQSKGGNVLEAFRADPMRCGGCGAKVGATTVSRVLNAIYERRKLRQQPGSPPFPPMDHDDAAIVLLPTPGAMIHTIDYFRSFISDPFLFGKIAAIHALSDVHAMGAKPQTALALAVIPFAAEEKITESTLFHLLAGASDIFQDEDIQLVGGHTCEGSELSCGFAIQGFSEFPDQLFRKKGGIPGDIIIMTKAIGTGALFAADMRAKAKGVHVVEALASMVQSNGMASQMAQESEGIHACTDVTGFGLVGHLLEMLMASDGSIGATLHLKSIPFLLGGLDASSRHIYSSLQANNARNRRAVVNHVHAAETCPVEYPLIFDPQTAGGLLFFVDPNVCDSFVAKLKTVYPVAAVIGEIVEYTGTCDNGLCTIGSGSTQTGERIEIECMSMDHVNIMNMAMAQPS